MRACYKSIFEVGEAERPSPDLGEVAKMCLAWAHQRVPEADGADWARNAEIMGDSGKLEVGTATAGSRRLWGLRLSHPDHDDETVRWATEVVLNDDGTRLRFACKNSFGSTDGVMTRMRRSPSRPRVVYEVLKAWGGHHAFPLSTRAKVLRDDDGAVTEFAEMLTNPARTRPIVLVSARSWDDRPSTDSGRVADYLCGLAHVWVAQNRFPSLKLRNHLPDNLNCWDGAVRVYWPRFTKLSPPYEHKFWRGDEVEHLEQRYAQGFREYLLGVISNVAVFAQDPMEKGWTDLEAARRRQAIAESRKTGDIDELQRLMDGEMTRLTVQVDQLQVDLSLRNDELRRAREMGEYWRGEYQRLSANRDEAPLSTPPEGDSFDSVADVIHAAERRFEERIAFALNGKSDPRSPFSSPQELWAALEFLATTYWETRTRGTQVDLEMQLRSDCGWSYAANQSEITMRRFEDWYLTRWNGKKVWLPSHVGKGSSKDPRRTIRVAFAWDDETQKVVVGFLGQHQKTTAT